MEKIIENILAHYPEMDFITLIRTPYKRKRINLENIKDINSKIEFSSELIKKEL
jgi:hypothetical protein